MANPKSKPDPTYLVARVEQLEKEVAELRERIANFNRRSAHKL